MNKARSDKMISMEAWKAAKMIEENLHMGILYQSSLEG